MVRFGRDRDMPAMERERDEVMRDEVVEGVEEVGEVGDAGTECCG